MTNQLTYFMIAVALLTNETLAQSNDSLISGGSASEVRTEEPGGEMTTSFPKSEEVPTDLGSASEKSTPAETQVAPSPDTSVKPAVEEVAGETAPTVDEKPEVVEPPKNDIKPLAAEMAPTQSEVMPVAVDVQTLQTKIAQLQEQQEAMLQKIEALVHFQEQMTQAQLQDEALQLSGQADQNAILAQEAAHMQAQAMISGESQGGIDLNSGHHPISFQEQPQGVYAPEASSTPVSQGEAHPLPQPSEAEAVSQNMTQTPEDLSNTSQ